MELSEESHHDLSNLLSVALANVEGMIDGLVPLTTARLEAIAESLRGAAELLRSSAAARKS